MSAPAPRPGTPPANRPPFEAEIRSAVRYVLILAIRALAALALIAAIVALRVYFFG